MLLYVPRKRGGLLGTWDRGGRGQRGKGTKEWRLDLGYRPKETGETVDRRQNNGSVKAVSPRHCPATCALRNCSFNCCVWAESQRQCPLLCCWRTTWITRSERSPTFSAQLHLSTNDLFWANSKVQLHLPPLRSLDLLISPGTLCHFCQIFALIQRSWWLGKKKKRKIKKAFFYIFLEKLFHKPFLLSHFLRYVVKSQTPTLNSSDVSNFYHCVQCCHCFTHVLYSCLK